MRTLPRLFGMLQNGLHTECVHPRMQHATGEEEQARLDQGFGLTLRAAVLRRTLGFPTH